MADTDYTHIASIMEAARPHVDIRTQITIDLMSKLFALMGCIQTMRKPNMAACGFENQKINVEGLLTAVRPLCIGRELAIVDQILSMFNAKRMYDTYKKYMDMMKDMNGFTGSPFGDFTAGSNPDNPSDNPTGFDFSSFFNGFANNASFNNQSGSEQKSSSGMESGSESVFNTLQNMFSAGQNASDTTQDKAADNESTSDSGSSYSKVYEALKAMLPPQQQSTYENSSMHFNNQSYDNNKSEQK